LTEQQSSYRQIFKATSLFGGVQVLQIIIGIIRTKFVAVLLGTTGVGIMGLFNAPLQLILSIAGLGITFSAVRDISEAYGSNDQAKTNRTVTTLRRWSWFAGILGTVTTIVISPFLSKWTFGNSEYTWAFIWLSITMLMQIISNGQKAVIQASKRLRDLAKASVYGSLIGLFTALPLYYFFGVKGIVPSLILTALTSLLLSRHFMLKIKTEHVRMSWHETINSGKSMIKLGLVLTFTVIIGFFTGYILNAFISRTGGIEQVGLYNAGWSIIGQSTGLVFLAMETDYFPRLSAINKDEAKINMVVNQQAEMVLFILAPILISLMGAMPIVIRLLYTSAFLPVVIFANWMLLGIMIKGLVWPAGFISPAKGNLKVFSIVEITAMVFNIIVNILGYYFFGLEGLGISFVVGYIFGLSLTLYYAHTRFGFKYNKETIQSFVKCFFMVSATFLISYFLNGLFRYLIAGLLLTISVIYSFIELDKRLDIRPFVREYIHKVLKK
jgi:O-antigen/teichoic acid export membrane protein